MGDSLGEVGGRLIDEAKAYARAEVDVIRQTGLAYARASVRGIVLVVVALLLLLSALPVLIAGFGMLLAIWIGAAAGLALAAVIVIALAGLLAWLALRSFGTIGSRVR